MRDGEFLQPCTGIADLLHLEADARQRLGHGLRIGIGVEIILEPGQGEFHRLIPPSSVGMSSAAKP